MDFTFQDFMVSMLIGIAIAEISHLLGARVR